MNKDELAFYAELLSDIKARVRRGQHRAAVSANAEMLLTSWDVGRMIAERLRLEGWVAAVIPRLAIDLKNDLTEERGFSTTNLKRILQFHREYPDLIEIGAPLVPQLESFIAIPQSSENVVDFVNEPSEVLEAFKTSFTTAELSNVTEPNIILNLRTKLDALPDQTCHTLI